MADTILHREDLAQSDSSPVSGGTVVMHSEKSARSRSSVSPGTEVILFDGARFAQGKTGIVGDSLVYRAGTSSDNWNFDGILADKVDQNTEGQLVFRKETDGVSLAEAINESDAGAVFIMNSANEDGRWNLTTEDLNAMQDVWDRGANVVMANEDNKSSDLVASNDVTDRLIGSRPYDERDSSDSGYGDGIDGTKTGNGSVCYSYIPPAGSHPIFTTETQDYLHRRSSEAPFSSNISPFTRVWDDSVNTWAAYESGGQRIWLDGSFARYSNRHADSCDGSVPYVENTVKWIDGQI